MRSFRHARWLLGRALTTEFLDQAADCSRAKGFFSVQDACFHPIVLIGGKSDYRHLLGEFLYHGVMLFGRCALVQQEGTVASSV